jgi:hypothetical protein
MPKVKKKEMCIYGICFIHLPYNTKCINFGCLCRCVGVLYPSHLMHSSLPVEEKPYSNYKCTHSTCLYRPVWVGLLYLFTISCVPALMTVGRSPWTNASAFICREECFCDNFSYSTLIIKIEWFNTWRCMTFLWVLFVRMERLPMLSLTVFIQQIILGSSWAGTWKRYGGV